jgi:acyl-coenzyme A synthetase/AMP-(fatty) acid ligase
VASQSEHPLLQQIRSEGDGGIVLFTSGSTGYPKAALQTSQLFLRKFSKPGRRFRTLAFLLFDHIAGLDTTFYTLNSGGTLILTRRRDPASIIRLIETHKVEVLPASPSFLRLLCRADVRGHDLSSLKVITYGSEPMDPANLALLNARFPDIQISQKYGTTETGAPKTVSRGNDSLWVKFKPGVETKVVDGVLWIRSESTFVGYLNAPSSLDKEGWYCTQDLVDVDGEWLRFKGRASEMISVGGEKVTPAEVENSILELEFVREVLVYGEPHSILGQIVCAKVVLTSDEVDRQHAVRSIWRHCREGLASYKAPVRVDVVTDGLTNDRQKLRRNGRSAIQ